MAPPAVQELPSPSKVVFKKVGVAGPVDPPKVKDAVTIPVPLVFHLTSGKAVPDDHAPAVYAVVELLYSSAPLVSPGVLP